MTKFKWTKPKFQLAIFQESRGFGVFPRIMNSVCMCVCACVFTDTMVMDEKVKTGVELDTVSANCSYDAHYKNHTKYWCRGYFRDSCNVFAFTPNSTKRVALKDTGSQLIITVSYLVKEDTGWYWCGIQRILHS